MERGKGLDSFIGFVLMSAIFFLLLLPESESGRETQQNPKTLYLHIIRRGAISNRSEHIPTSSLQCSSVEINRNCFT